MRLGLIQTVKLFLITCLTLFIKKIIPPYFIALHEGYYWSADIIFIDYIGTYAGFGSQPYEYEMEYGLWQVSKETVTITQPFEFNLGNKKWPLLKEMFSVLYSFHLPTKV